MKKYKITIQGWGAEVTIGSVNEEQKIILNNQNKELWEIAAYDLEEWGGWYEIDDQFHRWGASESFVIVIEDESGEVIQEIDSEELYQFDTDEFQLLDINYVEVDETKDLLMCASHEKGMFFEGEFEDLKFDITKLKIKIDGEIGIGQHFFGDMISSIYYDGQRIDNSGGSTESKSFDVKKNF